MINFKYAAPQRDGARQAKHRRSERDNLGILLALPSEKRGLDDGGNLNQQVRRDLGALNQTDDYIAAVHVRRSIAFVHVVNESSGYGWRGQL